MVRRLTPEERTIWSKLVQTVDPLPGRARPLSAPIPGVPIEKLATIAPETGEAKPPLALAKAPRPAPVAVLDSSWERRIATGALIPEMSIDLHGHTLEMAHKRLNQALDNAVARGVRVLLVVTGNPRPATVAVHGQKARGAIRAEIGDWLALSGHAEAIASVRTAHPRHGGRGALYIILRRK